MQQLVQVWTLTQRLQNIKKKNYKTLKFNGSAIF